MFRIFFVVSALLALISSAQADSPIQGQFWDEVVFTSLPTGGNEQVRVRAKLTQGGRPVFEFLKVDIGNQEIEVPKDLLKEIDWPDLRSFLLMSQKRKEKRTIVLSVRPQWKGPAKKAPVYTFEFSEGKLQVLYSAIEASAEKKILYTQKN